MRPDDYMPPFVDPVRVPEPTLGDRWRQGLADRSDPAAMRQATIDNLRGLSYLPWDMAGSVVDMANMVTSPFGLGTKGDPFMGANWMIDKAAEYGLAQPRTGSMNETGGRFASALLPGAASKAPQMMTNVAKNNARRAQKLEGVVRGENIEDVYHYSPEAREGSLRTEFAGSGPLRNAEQAMLELGAKPSVQAYRGPHTPEALGSNVAVSSARRVFNPETQSGKKVIAAFNKQRDALAKQASAGKAFNVPRDRQADSLALEQELTRRGYSGMVVKRPQGDVVKSFVDLPIKYTGQVERSVIDPRTGLPDPERLADYAMANAETGFSIDPRTGVVPKSGVAVANPGAERTVPKMTREDALDFLGSGKVREGEMFGGWPDQGQFYLDRSRVHRPGLGARWQTEKNYQRGAYDIGEGEDIPGIVRPFVEDRLQPFMADETGELRMGGRVPDFVDNAGAGEAVPIPQGMDELARYGMETYPNIKGDMDRVIADQLKREGFQDIGSAAQARHALQPDIGQTGITGSIPEIYMPPEPAMVMNPTQVEPYKNVLSGNNLGRLEQAMEGNPELRRAVKHMTPDEIEKTAARTPNIQKVGQLLSLLPKANEMVALAKAGAAKRGWYRHSANAIVDTYGLDDAPRFAAVLAAMSPQTSVQSNLRNTVNFWANWNNAGRPTDKSAIKRIMGASVEGDKGEESVLNAWVNNTVSAIQNPKNVQSMLSGPKVDSFQRNLYDDVMQLTNDTWGANWQYGDLPPTLKEMQLLAPKAKSAQSLFGGGTKGPGYVASNARQREAAARMGFTPEEVQETTWSWAKPAYEMAYGGPGRTEAINALDATDPGAATRLRGGLPKGGVQGLVEEGLVTPEVVSSTPDFGTLFAQPEYADVIRRGGNEPAYSPHPRAPTMELTSAEQKHLMKTAKRLDRLAKQRGKDTGFIDPYLLPYLGALGIGGLEAYDRWGEQ